jgi:TonB family protein
MSSRLAVALALTLASMLPAQTTVTNPALPAPVREPQLLPSQKDWPTQGKCGKSKTEWAQVSVNIDADGSPQQVAISDFSDGSAKDLATKVVQEDRFTPAERDGKPVEVRRMILVEMHVCTDKVKSTDGKKEEQTRLESEPRQTLYSLPAPPPPEQDAYKIGGHVSAPIPINMPVAEYTPEARKEHIEGEVMISLIVDAQGMPQNPRVVRPLPGGLNEAALNAVRRYRFKPAMKDGKTPVPVMVTIAVNFRLG